MDTTLPEPHGSVQTDLASSHVEDFVRRPTLEQHLDEARSDQGCRIVVLTGGPGSGKSAFLANLAKREPSYLCHFIRQDHQTPLQSGDAKTFLLNVGMQFSRRYPDIFETGQLQLNAKIVSRRVEKGSVVVAAKIGTLIANPFRRTTITATVEAEEIAGHVASAEIERVVEDGRLLSVDDLLQIALIDPLKTMGKSAPDEKIFILIDALDETRFSQGPDDALSFLSRLPELPRNVRIIATSRPDAAILGLLRRTDVKHIPLDQADLVDESATVITSIVRATSANLGPEFALALVAKAGSNFLYTRLILSSLRPDMKASEALTLLEQAPPGLQKLFSYFIAALVQTCEEGRLGKECWRRFLAPVLAALAVARQPLDRYNLVAFAALSIEETANVLREVGQFVSEHTGAGGIPVYSIFHSSFAEFLLDPTLNPEWSLDRTMAHRRISDWAFEHWGTLHASLPKLTTSGGKSSSEVYALTHLPFHLSAAAATSELQSLLTEFRWCAARLAFSGAVGLLDDFNLLSTEEFERLSNCVYLSLAALHDRRPGALAGQLLGRMQNTQTTSFWQKLRWRKRDRSTLERLLDGAREYTEEPWLRPLLRSLAPPAGHLRQVHRYPPAISPTALIHSIAISSNGTFAFGSSYANVIRWDLRTGDTCVCETGEGPRRLAASPDGRFCSWCDDTEGVVIYDWHENQTVFDKKLDIGPIRQIQFSHNAGFVVVAGSDSGALIATNDATYQSLPYLQAPFALTPDSGRILCANADTTVSFRQLRTGNIERTLSPLGETPRRLQMMPSGKRVIASGGGIHGESLGAVRVWELLDGTVRSKKTWAPAICGFGEGANGNIMILDLQYLALSLSFVETDLKMALDTMAINAALTPDGRTLVSFDGQGNLKVWNTTPFVPSPDFDRATTPVGAITFSKQGITLASVNFEGTKVWRTADGSLIKSKPGTSFLKYCAVSADGRFVAYENRDRQVCRADTWSGFSWIVKNDHEGQNLYTLVMSESGAVLAAHHSGRDNKRDGVRLMFFDTRTAPLSLDLQDDVISSIALSSDGQRLSTAGGKRLSIWECSSGTRLSDLDLPTEVDWSSSSFLGNRGFVALCCSDSILLIVDVQRKVFSEIKIDCRHLEHVCVSEDGSIVATARGSVVTAWDVRGKTKLADMDFGTRISATSISPDGNTIAVGDGIGSVHLLRVVKGRDV